jgi:dephospho-CoA kinase
MPKKTFYVGLTGGIACGKSTVQKRLSDHGIPVLDTDHLGHQLLQAGTQQAEQIRKMFGEDVMDADGAVNRPKLGKRVFESSDARKRLNAIMHPEIQRRWTAWMEERTEPLAVVAIPLLFEGGYANQFDGVLCVRASEEIMTQRLRLRGLSPEEVSQRIQAQWPVDRKAEQSAWTIDNNQTLDHLHAEVDRWVKQQNLPENNEYVGRSDFNSRCEG